MLSTRDPLTGLLVEPVLLEAISHELDGAPRYGAPSMVVVEVPGYEDLVGSRGALQTDLVLRRLSALLRSSSRRSDILGVLGPGRLCLLLPRTDHVRGQVVAQRVRQECGQLATGDLPLAVGLVHDPTALSPERVLTVVEQTMAHAPDARDAFIPTQLRRLAVDAEVTHGRRADD